MPAADSYPLHGGQLAQIARRFGIHQSELTDFSANINPDGPPLSVLMTLRASLKDLSTLTDYPDLEEVQLKQSIAHYAGVEADNVSVANGFVPLLDAALHTLNIHRCLLPVPAFVEYRKALERAGVEITLQPLSCDKSFRYNPVAMLAARHEAVLLANPQNPSGVCHDAAFMRDLIVAAHEQNMYVLLDEAFIDYVPEHSLAALTNDFPNLIVFRSVTKFHGIPGLRIAYAVGNREFTTSINSQLPPWPITTLAACAVITALADETYAMRSRSSNEAWRTLLKRDLEMLGLIVYPSAANFLLFLLPSTVDAGAFWKHMIVHHRIVLRACINYEGHLDRHLRVAVRTASENKKLIDAIQESLLRLMRSNGSEQETT